MSVSPITYRIQLLRRTGQRGYGAFSVSPSQLDAVVQYVKAQQEHHRTQTFREEYRELLRRHGVDFDERYSLGLRSHAEVRRAFSAGAFLCDESWGTAPG